MSDRGYSLIYGISTSVKGNPLLVVFDRIILAHILSSTFEYSVECFNGTIEEIIDDGEVIICMKEEFQDDMGSNVANASG